MYNPILNIRILGYALVAVYAVSFYLYLIIGRSYGLELPALTLAILFAVLAVCSLGVAWLKEASRKLLVWVNIIVAIVMASFYFIEYYENFTNPGYIIGTLLIALFFNRESVRTVFRGPAIPLRKSILIIDDDESFLKTVRPILIANGFSVLTTTTGEKGFNIAKIQKPDLIVLDVILPGLKGREVCVKLKDDPDTREIPVVFLTAKDSPDDIKAEMAVGGISHLTKPINSRDLLSEVKKILQ